MKKLLVIFFIGVLANSCKTEVQSETSVYSNDFEGNDLSNITSGITTNFNNSTVLGRYNKGGFMLTLNGLPKHKMVTITFDLYIHDNWRGNMASPDGPDIWEMTVDGKPYIYTTFSNLECPVGQYCPPQSYPLTYPNNFNNPQAGADSVNLYGACSLSNTIGKTALYKITRTFSHSANTLLLKCVDKLVQPNSTDPKCDESWSVDNIVVKTIEL